MGQKYQHDVLHDIKVPLKFMSYINLSCGQMNKRVRFYALHKTESGNKKCFRKLNHVEGNLHLNGRQIRKGYSETNFGYYLDAGQKKKLFKLKAIM